MPSHTIKLLQDDPHYQPNPTAHWSPSHNIDVRRPQLIVLHHTEMRSAKEALRTLQTSNDLGRVSAHYLIGADGELFQLVAEGARAWHAGQSRWAGRDDLNSSSIGIELDNDGQSDFSAAQLRTLLLLLGDICARQKISPRQVIAHGDIAPTRKSDPSARFPWRTLADAGFGLWPRAEFIQLEPANAHFDPWLALAFIGYDLRDRRAAVKAFRRHYFAVEGADDPQFSAIERAVLADLQAQLLEQ
ncbi:N-acetylmuramoyl-L-alanine amidase [bacterium]|nr:N-acetylmuramoyl-L-alanine amidase [bacterium]